MFMLPNLSKILYTFQPNVVNKFNIISVNFSDRCCNSMCSCLYIYRSLIMSLQRYKHYNNFVNIKILLAKLCDIEKLNS